MKKKIWTAVSINLRNAEVLIAQCKSSKKELLDRLMADDPLWHRGIHWTRMNMLNKSKFRKGLAMAVWRF